MDTEPTVHTTTLYWDGADWDWDDWDLDDELTEEQRVALRRHHLR